MEKRRNGILVQVATLFVMGVLVTGILVFSIQGTLTHSNVKKQTVNCASIVADEVAMSVKEYPAYEWLMRYWYEHSDELDIEYDATYDSGTATETKSRLLSKRHPGIQLKYVDEQELKEMSDEDQKLYAEIAYSWLITRINEIKRSWNVEFLFCVLTDESYKTQFFLFSAAEEGAVRGTDYKEVYPLGVETTVSKSLQEAMRSAVQDTGHLADAGDYVDYYSYLGKVDGQLALIGMTYNLSALRTEKMKQTIQETVVSVAHQIFLSILCLILIYLAVLHPLKQVQRNIHIYKETKDSKTVIGNLKKIRANNEIGRLSEDVADLADEIDHYLNHIATITAEKERIGTELALATRIQADMLPDMEFSNREEFDIYATMTPAKEVGGDFYDFFMVDDDHLCMVMADVSGKGIPAALFMMASKIILANNAMLGKSPAQILEDTNAAICSNNQEEMFVTVWLGILELSTGLLTAANAGHEYPVIRYPDGCFALYKDKHGFVIGGMEGVKYKEYKLQLESGAKLFLYTDGVPEAMNAGDKCFGIQRMIEALNREAGAEPRGILQQVQAAVDDFVKDAKQFDDLTMLCMEYRGRKGEPMASEYEIEIEARTDNLQEVLAFVNARLEKADCSRKAQMQMNIAVEEIFVNIAHYAYAPATGKVKIRVETAGTPAEGMITFTDEGIPYNPLAKEDPDVTLSAEERVVGGLGIFMVKNTMDDMRYEYRDGKNILTIVKRL